MLNGINEFGLTYSQCKEIIDFILETQHSIETKELLIIEVGQQIDDHALNNELKYGLDWASFTEIYNLSNKFVERYANTNWNKTY